MKLWINLFDGHIAVEPMPNGEHWKFRIRPNAGSSLILEMDEIETVAKKLLDFYDEIKGYNCE